MINEEKKETAKAVLDYWLTLELLTQERIPRCTRLRDKNQGNKQTVVFDLNSYEKLGDKVSDKSDKLVWDKITVYLGLISRNCCLEKIVSKISKDEGNTASANSKKEMENYDEDPDDEIALASIQLNSDGTYIKSSLSISPVLWIVKHDISSDEETKKSYESSSVEVEKRILKFLKLEANGSEDDSSSDKGDEVEEDEPGSFSSVDYEALEKTCEIVASYFGVEKEEKYNPTIRVSVRYFRKDKKDEDAEENDFSNRLSRQFYSRDISLVKDKIQKGEAGNNENGLFDFINALNEKNEKKDRLDLLSIKNRDDREEYYGHFFEILDVENMPLGKWPSIYTTALMQQIAGNIATSEKYSGIFAGRSSIFSVNGPPGTGKTTLLQEIIANNVVKKALLLCDVKKPDDVFEEVKIDKNFPKAIKKAYRIKKEYDKLNDYGILLASNNNDAVEITSRGLLNDFSEKLKDEAEHSKEYKESLDEVRELFDPKDRKSINYFRQASNKLYYEYISKNEPEGKLKEIESENKKRDKPTWGLISAPLGKTSNIRKFKYGVLGTYRSDQNDSDKMSFSDAVDLFKKQYDKVLRVRKGLLAIQTLVKDKEEAFSIMESLETESKKFCDEEIKILSKPVEEYCNKEQKRASLQKELNSIHLINSHSLKMLGMIIWHFFNVLFDKTPDAYDNEREKKKKVEDLKGQIKELSEELDSLRPSFDKNKEKLERKMEQLGEVQEKNKSISSKIKELESKKSQLKEKKIKAVHNYEKLSKDLQDMLDRNYSSDLDRIVLFDSAFLDKMTGSSEEKAEVHCQNPWETVRFKREREKLFARALLVIKHFVKESEHCKENLTELSNYWDYQGKKDFKGEDVKALFPSYFQSLMLLVPVVSTTFASVGRMLNDIEEPNVLGTLIVDEAGQALPQMAVGALFRCRKAVVVGDPAQVEPIVNDDLKIVRSAFARGKALKKYVDSKIASIQNYADILNKFGTDVISNSNEWSGTPLIIHRRCIAPMFDISNNLSYKNEMICRSVEPAHGNYYLPSSVWIDSKGKETNKHNHYVKEQAEKVWEILFEIFGRDNNKDPSVFVITPFKSVEKGIKQFISDKANSIGNNQLADWKVLNKHIGTIHTFQGKEADEVIFVLGCDDKTGIGTFDFVKENIVNVAVSRAKYRLYVVGDIKTWTKNNRFLAFVNQEIIANLLRKLNDENLTNADKRTITGYLPYERRRWENGEGEEEESFDTTMLTLSAKNNCPDIFKNLTQDKLQRFGFDSFDEIKGDYSDDVKANLQLGMYIYYASTGFVTEKDDVSFSSILFCKAIEQQLKDSLLVPLKKYCGDSMMKRKGKDCPFSQLEDNDITIGTFYTMFNRTDNEKRILQDSHLKGDEMYREWYKKFKEKLDICREKRNECCHPHKFRIEDQKIFIDNVFFNCDSKEKGIFFESRVGKKM